MIGLHSTEKADLGCEAIVELEKMLFDDERIQERDMKFQRPYRIYG